eukprot:SAG31_NODE_31604_length_366_cov_0.775281_1_plen_20_part_10
MGHGPGPVGVVQVMGIRFQG